MASSGRNNSKARNEIIEMLKADHLKVKKAFRTAQKLDAQEDREDLQALVEQTCAEIEVHARLEEELFYPAAREALKEQDLIDEAEVEHGSAKALIAQLRELSPDDEKYTATFKVLGEYLKHHIKEEETELFEQVGGRSKVQWEELQQQMLTMRETLMAEMGLGEEQDAAEEESKPAARSRAAARSRSEQSADQEETVE
jgi:hemerythrin-like domain-containing protein